MVYSRRCAFLCSRTEPYIIPEEFNRARSLVIQRFQQSNASDLKTMALKLQSINNCLNIQYAVSDSQMGGAEGFFALSSTSTPDNLQIFVSPKYQANDDLLTALLLSHEMVHAIIKAAGTNNTMSCFENEAYAFAYELSFLQALNAEEKNSLTQRYYSNSSINVYNDMNTLGSIFNYPVLLTTIEHYHTLKVINFINKSVNNASKNSSSPISN